MAAVFDRPAFKGGVFVIEVTVGPDTFVKTITPGQRGKSIAFDTPAQEAAFKAKYPEWLLADGPAHTAKKAARATARANREKLVF